MIFPELSGEAAAAVVDGYHREARAAGVARDSHRRDRSADNDGPPNKRHRSSDKRHPRDDRRRDFSRGDRGTTSAILLSCRLKTITPIKEAYIEC